MGFRIDQLYVHDNISSSTSGELLIQNKPQEDASSLFFIGEYDSNTNDSQRFLQQLINRLYIRFEQNTVQNAEKFLEALLQELNEFIPEILPKEKMALKKFHCLLAVGDKKRLHFSTYGRIKALLIRGGGMFDAVNASGEDTNERSAIFSATIESELKLGDRYLFCNENVLNYIAKDKVKKAMTALPPTSVVAHFTNLLEMAPKNASFLGIVIEYQQSGASDLTNFGTITENKETSRASLEKMVLSQKETDSILNPPGTVKKILNTIEIFYQETRDLVLPFIKKNKTNFSALRPKSNAKQLVNNSVNTFKNLFINYKNKYSQLERKNKIIIWVCLVLLVFFVQNLAFAGQRQTKKNEEKLFTTNLQQIQTYSNEIEAALLYEDFEKAQITFTQIEELIKQLPQNSRERIDKIKQLSDMNAQLANRVWLKQDLGSGKNVVIELSQKLNDKPTTFTSYSNQAFTIASNSKIITGTGNNFSQVTSTPITAAINTSDKNGLFFGKDNAYRCDEKNCITLAWEKPANLTSVKAVGTYLNRVYVLDNSLKAIYRFNISGNSLSGARQWNKTNDNLDKVSSIYVDTAIHLAIEQKLEKWSGGVKENEQSYVINPNISNIDQVVSGEKYKYVWLLDKANKRVVAINPSTNKVVQQLISDVLTQAISININEGKKTVYVLTEQNIVELNYKQFTK